MTQTTTKVILGAVAMLLANTLVGCGAGALQVRRGAWSGELALHGDVTTAEYAAQRAMLDHCGGRSRILSRREAEQVALVDGGSVARELAPDGGHRVHYLCVSRAPATFRAAPGDDSISGDHTASIAARDGI